MTAAPALVPAIPAQAPAIPAGAGELFSKVPRWFWDIPQAGQQLFIELWFRGGFKARKMRPTDRTISGWCGRSMRWVQKAIRQLLDVVVEGGRVSLADEPQTLAGSVLTMDAAVRTLVASGVPIESAVAAATRTPADAIDETTGETRLSSIVAPLYA